jgi:hypothetical protein
VATTTRKFLVHAGVPDEELYKPKQPRRKLLNFTSPL